MREKDLSAELESRLREYCDRALGAGELSGDVREELYAHFRDRVLGYLNREDELSEADAFLLAREHFGDPVAVRGMLLNEHAADAVPNLYRRMAAGAIVLVLLEFAGNAFFRLLITVNILSMNTAWLTLVWPIFCTPLAYLAFRLWQAEASGDNKPWFLRWPPLGLAALLLTIYGGVGAVHFDKVFHLSSVPRLDTVVGVLVLLNSALQAMLWFWWCCIPLRAPRLFLHALLGFALYGWPLFSIVELSQHGLNLSDRFSALAGSVAFFPIFVIHAAIIGLLFLGLRRLAPARTT
jgi:hypothetical protein